MLVSLKKTMLSLPPRQQIKCELADRKQSFTGSFGKECQEQSVSPYMLTGFESTDSSKLSIPLVLAQLLAFNTAEKRSTTADFRNNADHETPVSIYIAFLIHSKTRSKDLVNRLHSLGLCISYDRLSTLSTQLGNSVVKRFEKDGLVCPVSLRNNVFTTHAVDNIDHNPSSRTAQDSWHGTAISAGIATSERGKRCGSSPGPRVSKRQTTHKDITSTPYGIH